MLGGKAEHRNVTSLAGTVDGATARALGWLLNKSPWPTRPVVDALQLYVGNTFGTQDGLFTLNIDNFVKRGDNAVGVEKQFVHHLGRTSNSQVGVFLAYGTAQNSALVDAALYMPHSWIDDAARREKAGVPASLRYQTRNDLALSLLRQARAGGHLPGHWVTSWHGEGFKNDLRTLLDADGWRYLLPVPAAASFYPAPDAVDLLPYERLLTAQPAEPFQLVRVWEPAAEAARQPAWLVGCTDRLTGGPVAFLSNAPEDASAELFGWVLAAHWQAVRMLVARYAGVSLDVYRVRGWDGWHRHVVLALLASAFRACLTDLSAAEAAEETGPLAPEAQPLESAALTFRAPADAVPAVPAPVIPPTPEEMAVSIDEPAAHPAHDAEVASSDPLAVPPSTLPTADTPSTYRLVVDVSESEWRAVRALQVWLVADRAGSILGSTPSKAQIEREEVGGRVEVRFQSTQSCEQLLAALDEVPDASLIELVAEGAAAPAVEVEAPAAPSPAPTVATEPGRYALEIDIQETDWRAVRAFQVWMVVDEAGVIYASSPSKAEIERQEVGPKMLVQLETHKSAEQLLAALHDVPEITIVSLTAAGTPVAAPDPVTASAAEEPPAAELADTDELLAALEAELAERSTAREAGLMPAFEGPIEVVENAVIEANIILEETRDLMGVGSANGTSGTNGHATTNGAAAVSNLVTPTAPPPTPTTEGPVRSTVAAQPPTTPTAAPKPQPAERVRPAEEQMVVLDVGDESYGIPVKQVREIIRVPPITRVPNGPSFLEGVINLRGQVIPVMDLRKHLGIVGGSETRRSRVVVSELGRHTVGLMVDAVSEVVMVSAADIEPPPAIIAGANDGQICGVVRLGDRLVLFLDPERMLPNR